MKKQTRNRILWFVVIVVVIVILLLIPVTKRASAESAQESLLSITDAVKERALQCYVIEGAYPSSLSYLEENYGLTVNKEDYLVIYTPVAENLPPDVRVVRRSGE